MTEPSIQRTVAALHGALVLDAYLRDFPRLVTLGGTCYTRLQGLIKTLSAKVGNAVEDRSNG